MKRGLRMAAKVAAVAGVLAAAGAQPAAASEPVERITAPANATTTTPTELAENLRIGGAKGCGCGPCWGPPAPPDMSWTDSRDGEALV